MKSKHPKAKTVPPGNRHEFAIALGLINLSIIQILQSGTTQSDASRLVAIHGSTISKDPVRTQFVVELQATSGVSAYGFAMHKETGLHVHLEFRGNLWLHIKNSFCVTYW